MRRLVPAMVALLAAATPALAAAPALPRVVLVRPVAAPPSVSQALVRLRGELIAAGFDAEVMDLPLGADVRASLEKFPPPASNTRSATALVAVVPSQDPGNVELWVIDRATGKTVIRRVNAPPGDPGRVAEVLAVRAVELLRASFLELAITPPAEMASPAGAEPPAPAPPPMVERWATAPLEERDWTWAIEAGGGTAVAAAGAGFWNVFLPVARVERALGRRVCIRLGFAGLGTAGHVPAANGSGDLYQTVVLAEVLYRFHRGHRLEPLISLGAGALWLSTDAHETSPYQPVGGTRWGAAADVGVGLRIPLHGRRFEVGAEVHALLSQPYPTVQYFGDEIARAGRPTLLASLTLLGGL